MIKQILIALLILSTPVLAGDDLGKVFFGKNFAKPASEHTDRLYLQLNDSEKLYFNKKHNGPVLDNLDTNKDHTVKVYFDNKLVTSWKLNFSKLKTPSVIIWRASGSWRMDVLDGFTAK